MSYIDRHYGGLFLGNGKQDIPKGISKNHPPQKNSFPMWYDNIIRKRDGKQDIPKGISKNHPPKKNGFPM